MKNLMKLSLLALTLISFSFINLNEKNKEEINVVIDAGHGGIDLGATMNGLSEKSIVESISTKIRIANNNSNVKIHFTRTEDKLITLQERVDFINGIKPDLVISLHANSSKNSDANGIECFVSDKSSEYVTSNELAEKLMTSFSLKTPLNIRGVKKAPFFILKKSEVPAITLEIGYISNTKDKDYISTENGQTEIAKIILDFASNLKS
ncbi:N-acetylmuramoyl-L-alanine amidase [Flavobacterium sp.]|uniref:N-acetylmuramoyl-L-alanine amidase family protein n=1 Tax=Flavobacterium sp. TaxID=239 RepID=UPI00374D63B5